MAREYYWQKAACCELGCVYYKRRDDGTEACEKVGYRLHPDWCEVAMDCETFENEQQRQARLQAEEMRRRLEKQARKRARKALKQSEDDYRD